jgi:succinate dehydrogenase hydrophobic anchor subunit
MAIASTDPPTISVFADWLHLLDGPRQKVFAEIVEQENWSRLFKLLTLALFLSGAIVGVRLTIEYLLTDGPKSVLESQLALTFLIVGAMLATLYNGIARLFGIALTLPKSFFIILSLGLPWIPIFTVIDVIPSLPPFKLQGIIFLLSHLVLIKPIFNFIAGVKSVTGCAGWRVAVSIILPIIFFMFLVVYMFS